MRGVGLAQERGRGLMQMRRWQMAVILAMITCAAAQAERTVGLLHHGDASTEGYTLFSPMNGLNTFLVDHDGRAVHSWTHTRRPGHGFYLLEDGSLLRAAIAEGDDDALRRAAPIWLVTPGRSYISHPS